MFEKVVPRGWLFDVEMKNTLTNFHQKVIKEKHTHRET